MKTFHAAVTFSIALAAASSSVALAQPVPQTQPPPQPTQTQPTDPQAPQQIALPPGYAIVPQSQSEPEMTPAPLGSPIVGMIPMPPNYSGTPWKYPRKLGFDEDRAPPVGYHVGTEPIRPIWITGLTIFASVYGVTALVGGAIAASDEPTGLSLFVPVAGPTIFAAQQQQGGAFVAAMSVIGLAQGAGLGLLIGGLAGHRKVLVRNDVEAPPLPTVSLGPGSVAMRLAF